MTVTAATGKEREDEGGGFSQRRQGQLLRHDEVYPIRSPDCGFGEFDAG